MEQLQAILPADAAADAALQQIDQLERLAKLYDEAKDLMSAGHWDQALMVLTEVQTLDPHYRDVPHLLQVAQTSQKLDDQLQVAREAFANQEWTTAIAQLETLSQTDFTFRFEEIQTLLFESYLNQGRTLIVEGGSQLEQVNEAVVVFDKALEFRPLDNETLHERRLAETYIVALNSVDQDEQIELLLEIYEQQPAYAGGAVGELLYTTLLSRAEVSEATGDRTAAIADYETALRLAVENTSLAQENLAKLITDSPLEPIER